MTISPLTIYLWQLADKAEGLFSGMLFPASIVSIVGLMGFIISTVEKHESKPIFTRVLKFSVPSIIALGMLRTLIPSSNTIAMMFVIPKLAESKAVQQDLPDLYDIAIKALKDQLAPKK